MRLRRARSQARASTCSRMSHPPTGGWRSCRRSSRRRTSRPRRSKRRNRSASRPPGVRDFLQEGVIRNAVNFPRCAGAKSSRACGRISSSPNGCGSAGLPAGRRPHAFGRHPVLWPARDRAARTSLRAPWSPGRSGRMVVERDGRERPRDRGRTRHRGRGIPQQSPRAFVEHAVGEAAATSGGALDRGHGIRRRQPRLTQLDGVAVEVPLVDGTLLVIRNEDRAGVIGEVGTMLGRHGMNIGSFALGRGHGGAVERGSSSTRRTEPRSGGRRRRARSKRLRRVAVRLYRGGRLARLSVSARRRGSHRVDQVLQLDRIGADRRDPVPIGERLPLATMKSASPGRRSPRSRFTPASCPRSPSTTRPEHPADTGAGGVQHRRFASGPGRARDRPEAKLNGLRRCGPARGPAPDVCGAAAPATCTSEASATSRCGSGAGSRGRRSFLN